MSSVLQVYIQNVTDESIGGFTMPLPATNEDIRPFFEGAEIMEPRDMAITGVYTDIRGLAECVIESIETIWHPDILDEINYLSAKVAGLDDGSREVFIAALEKENPGSVADIINLTENLGIYHLQPAFDSGQYGDFLLDMAQDDFSDIFNKLANSNNPDERAFAKHIERLEKHVNQSAYAKAIAVEEGGVFTKSGYLIEDCTSSNIYCGIENIPPEYLITFPPEPEPLMVANSDLTALVTQIHALGGDYSKDLGYNINVLEARRSSEYLMLMTESKVYLTEAAHAYRHDSSAYNTITSADATSTKAYALHVTDVQTEHVMGDMIALDLAELQEDIRQHCIHFTHVDAVPKFGPEQSIRYSPEEWKALEPIDRDRLESWTRHFSSDDLQSVIRHLNNRRQSDEAEMDGFAGAVLEPSELLATLNEGYMQKAEVSQPDMLRITLPAAKDILINGDAEVYRLLPEGAEKLTPLHLLPSRGELLYIQYREFAIKKDDVAGLDKWADREIARHTARPERDDHEKTRNRTQGGPEL